MSKPDLQSLATNLAPLADQMPVQRPPLAVVESPPRPGADRLVQFSFELRKSLRRQIEQLAEDADTTMRSFVLTALRDKGLDVRDDDLVDLRKQRR